MMNFTDGDWFNKHSITFLSIAWKLFTDSSEHQPNCQHYTDYNSTKRTGTASVLIYTVMHIHSTITAEVIKYKM